MSRVVRVLIVSLVGAVVAIAWIQCAARFREPPELTPLHHHSAHCGCKSTECTAEPGDCAGCCGDPKTPAMELCDCAQTPGAE